jgi:hypothetical protein
MAGDARAGPKAVGAILLGWAAVEILPDDAINRVVVGIRLVSPAGTMDMLIAVGGMVYGKTFIR